MHAHCCLAAGERPQGGAWICGLPIPRRADNGNEFYAECIGATRLVFPAGRG